MVRPLITLATGEIYLYKKMIDSTTYEELDNYLKNTAVQRDYGDEIDIFYLDEYSIVSLCLNDEDSIENLLRFLEQYSYNEVPNELVNKLNTVKENLKVVSLKLGTSQVLLKVLEGDLEFLFSNNKLISEKVKYDEVEKAYGFNVKDSFKIIKELNKEKVTIRFPAITTDVNIDVEFNKNIELRYYQENAYKALIITKLALLLMPIVSGKNYVALKLISHIKKKTLILCEEKNICGMWEDDTKLLTSNTSILNCEDEKDGDIYSHDIVICSYEMIRRKKDVFDKLMNIDWGVIIYDNAHKVVTDKAIKVLYLNSEYKYAFASTLSRIDNKGSELINLFRSNMYNITSKELREKLYQKKLEYRIIDIRDKMNNKQQVVEQILNANQYNKVIVASHSVDEMGLIYKDCKIKYINNTNIRNKEELDETKGNVESFNNGDEDRITIGAMIARYHFKNVDAMIETSYNGKSLIEEDYRTGNLISTDRKLTKAIQVIKYYIISSDEELENVYYKINHLKASNMI